MEKKISLVLALISILSTLKAQNTTDTSKTKKAFWETSFSIRKAFEDKNDKEKPAVFSLTWPDQKEKTFLINGGLSLSLNRIKHKPNISSKSEYDFFVVYNRNNQIDKVQNNLKTGLAMDFKFGSSDRTRNEKSYAKIFPTVQYMFNRVDTTHSFITTLYYTQIIKMNGFQLNGYQTIAGSGWQYYIGPVVGLEYQDRFNVKKPELKGGISRLYYGGDFRLAVKVPTEKGKKAALGNKVAEITVSYAGRNDFINNTAGREGQIYLFKTELNFFPLKSEDLSIGVLYNDGQDPIAALEKQKFWQFAIKFKRDFSLK